MDQAFRTYTKARTKKQQESANRRWLLHENSNVHMDTLHAFKGWLHFCYIHYPNIKLNLFW